MLHLKHFETTGDEAGSEKINKCRMSLVEITVNILTGIRFGVNISNINKDVDEE